MSQCFCFKIKKSAGNTNKLQNYVSFSNGNKRPKDQHHTYYLMYNYFTWGAKFKGSYILDKTCPLPEQILGTYCMLLDVSKIYGEYNTKYV